MNKNKSLYITTSHQSLHEEDVETVDDDADEDGDETDERGFSRSKISFSRGIT